MGRNPLIQLFQAVSAYMGSWFYDYEHPANPHGDAELELKQEMMEGAIVEYVRHNPELLRKIEKAL